ncbi:MAG: hypothetical protein P8I03_05715, partial [Thalassotalea sp.]|nr:hypothetical protein [Thalassotalea sp.]
MSAPLKYIAVLNSFNSLDLSKLLFYDKFYVFDNLKETDWIPMELRQGDWVPTIVPLPTKDVDTLLESKILSFVEEEFNINDYLLCQ